MKSEKSKTRFVLCHSPTPGAPLMAIRILRMRAFAPFLVLSALTVRHASLNVTRLHCLTQCISGRQKKPATPKGRRFPLMAVYAIKMA
jgi:hypothetical protein